MIRSLSYDERRWLKRCIDREIREKIVRTAERSDPKLERLAGDHRRREFSRRPEAA